MVYPRGQKNKLCYGGGNRTRDRHLMRVASYHCYTPRYTREPHGWRALDKLSIMNNHNVEPRARFERSTMSCSTGNTNLKWKGGRLVYIFSSPSVILYLFIISRPCMGHRLPSIHTPRNNLFCDRKSKIRYAVLCALPLYG